MNRNIKVDVVIPFHRNDTYFNESVISILKSKDVKPRIILVDDRPRDDKSSIPNFGESVVVKTFGIGYSKALRIGLSEVTSDFFALQDSDDVAHPLRLCTQLQALLERRADIATCGLMRVRESGAKYLLQQPMLIDSNIVRISNLVGSYNSNSTWLCNSTLLEYRGFMPEEYQSVDWATTLQLPESFRFALVPHRLYRYRQHKSQMTRSQVYHDSAFSQIYSLWADLNNSFKLPELNRIEAALLAAPWSSIYIKDGLNRMNVNHLKHWLQVFFDYPNIKSSPDMHRLKLLIYRNILKKKHLLGAQNSLKLLSVVGAA